MSYYRITMTQVGVPEPYAEDTVDTPGKVSGNITLELIRVMGVGDKLIIERTA